MSWDRLAWAVFGLAFLAGCSNVIQPGKTNQKHYSCTGHKVVENSTTARGPEDIVFDWTTNKAYVSLMQGDDDEPGIYVTDIGDRESLVFAKLPVNVVEPHGLDLDTVSGTLYAIDHAGEDSVKAIVLTGTFPTTEYAVGKCERLNDISVGRKNTVEGSCNGSLLSGLLGKSTFRRADLPGAAQTTAKSAITFDTAFSKGRFANGLAHHAGYGETFVAYSLEGRLYFGDRPFVEIGGLPDNLSWGKNQDFLYVATHRNAFRFFVRLFGSPSHFYRIDARGIGRDGLSAAPITELVLANVEPVAPSVVTPVSNDRLLVGSVYGDSVYLCRPKS